MTKINIERRIESSFIHSFVFLSSLIFMNSMTLIEEHSTHCKTYINLICIIMPRLSLNISTASNVGQKCGAECKQLGTDRLAVRVSVPANEFTALNFALAIKFSKPCHCFNIILCGDHNCEHWSDFVRFFY